MIAAVVLAAGTSSRLGVPKQLLEVRGRPLLQHVVDACVAAGLPEVVVVLGHEATRIRDALDLPDPVRVVVNPHFERGQSTSLVAGVSSLGPDVEAALIVLGDQPGMTPELIRKVVDAWRDTGASVVRAHFSGVPGHPVLIARAEWPLLLEATGDVGARDLFERVGGKVVEADMGVEPLVDVDTWEQYERMRDED